MEMKGMTLNGIGKVSKEEVWGTGPSTGPLFRPLNRW
jgi:hypothetical protein